LHWEILTCLLHSKSNLSFLKKCFKVFILIIKTIIYIGWSKSSRNTAVSIHRNNVSSVFLHHILEIVLMMFCGKFHLFNSLLRYLFEIKIRDWIDLLSYDPYYIVVAGDHLVYSKYISTTNSLKARPEMNTSDEP
jgi:hypothetical protein